jgi:hypothetical protein
LNIPDRAQKMLYTCLVSSDSWCLKYKYDLYMREVDTLYGRCKDNGQGHGTELFISTHRFIHLFTF